MANGAITAAPASTATTGVPTQAIPQGCPARIDGPAPIGFRRQQESRPCLQHAMPAMPSVAANATTGTSCPSKNSTSSHSAGMRRRP